MLLSTARLQLIFQSWARFFNTHEEARESVEEKPKSGNDWPGFLFYQCLDEALASVRLEKKLLLEQGHPMGSKILARIFHCLWTALILLHPTREHED
ncbi:hypothetical protein NDU88_006906 [Pleurodeles waltl]|uniref:Uncharacterized protein n=1 Tax=Pleurodeles waltl TaxID=8319 RepID=A0AAV7UN40_PLEWA|nr:hypothetical protein NDU88_006906 [Pleurodeles waltl]